MDIHINADQEVKESDAPVDSATMAKYVAYARHTCHPRISEGAASALRNHYVRFRKLAKEKEMETKQQSAIPITVRQLEAIIRLTESLAKMELCEEANENHVKEAVRLFTVATLKAANQSAGKGEANYSDPDFMKAVQKAERLFRQRLALGSTTSVKRIVQDLDRLGNKENAILKAIEVMHARGEIQFLNRRYQIKRLR